MPCKFQLFLRAGAPILEVNKLRPTKGNDLPKVT